MWNAFQIPNYHFSTRVVAVVAQLVGHSHAVNLSSSTSFPKIKDFIKFTIGAAKPLLVQQLTVRTLPSRFWSFLAINESVVSAAGILQFHARWLSSIIIFIGVFSNICLFLKKVLYIFICTYKSNWENTTNCLDFKLKINYLINISQV